MKRDEEDDLPEGIPEEDRQDFIDLRREQIELLIGGISPSPNETAIKMLSLSEWGYGLENYEPQRVLARIKERKSSPDQPLSSEHPRSPLTDLSLLPRTTNQKDSIDRHKTIEGLIRSGATLTHRDYCRLLPADYACIAHDPENAATIVMATLKHIEEKNLDLTWRPALNRLFATIPDKSERACYHQNLVRNAAAIRNAITKAIEEEDPAIMQLMQTWEEADYWLNFKAPPMADLPSAPARLTDQFNKIKAIEKSMVTMKGTPKFYDLKLWCDDEAFKLRFLQWETVRFIP